MEFEAAFPSRGWPFELVEQGAAAATVSTDVAVMAECTRRHSPRSARGEDMDTEKRGQDVWPLRSAGVVSQYASVSSTMAAAWS
ncbi:hypothetical protein ABZ930_07680 [Streptomyces sp. NPDC046716]|uniref:hypothetical protein n=1 Tax=Streptomyces sp. NPDC046716 TaxID=3157093 RepID=UPI0033E65093